MGAVEVLSLLTAAVAGVTGAVQWRRRRVSPSTRPLALVMLGGASWALAEVLADVAPEAPQRAVAGYVVLPSVGLVVAGAFWYAMIISGRGRLLTRRTALLLAVEPVLVVLASATDPWHHLVVATADGGLGTLFWLHTAYSYGLLAVVVVVLVRAMSRAVRGHRWVFGLLLLSMTPPVVGNVVSLVLDARDVDLTPVLFLVTASLWLWVEHGRRDLRRTPIRTHQVLRALTDAVVVLDDDGRVVDVNPAGLALLERPGTRTRDVVGRPWSALAGPVLGAELRVDGPSMVVLPDGRVLDVRVTPVRGSDDAVAGSVLVARDVTELERLRAELSEQALRDPLTGLHNRRHLEEALRGTLGRAPDEPVAAVLVDIDHFKTVNDRYGHQVGDEVLVAVAAELRASVRPGDVVSRVGGEEFALVLTGVGAEEVVRRAERLRRRCAGLAFPGAADLRITVSAGVATLAADEPDVDELFAAADAAMYRAKAAGRDRVVLAGSPGPA